MSNQLDMFADIDFSMQNENFQKRQRDNPTITFWWDQYMVALLASWTMLDPLRLTLPLKSDFPEYYNAVINFMSRHDNRQIYAELYSRAEKLVDMGYWKRFHASFVIKYQNPRSFSGKMLKAYVKVVGYGRSANDL
ncbi:MAG: hypothetical protein CUN56_16180, partial [Phototrophicales bacterium]